MSDRIKMQLMNYVTDESAYAGMSRQEALMASYGIARAEAAKRCDECGEPFGDNGFRMYDYMCPKECHMDDTMNVTQPRVMCRECYDERAEFRNEPPPAYGVWFVPISPVMDCPKCRKSFANRYAKRHANGLPVNGEAGKIVCYGCEREQIFKRGDTGECVWCAKWFDKTRSDAKYCSAKCRTAASRAARKVNADDTTD